MSKFVLAAATLCAGLLAGCASTGSPAAPGPSIAASAPASASPSIAAIALGPAGFGPLTLGMTLDQAEATGIVTPVTGTAPDGGCDTRAKIAAGASGSDGTDGTLYFSPNIGLASITAYGDVKTPEGIGLGSTLDEVKAAYPKFELDEESASGYVPVGTTATYRIGISKDDKVESILLQSLKQDCYE